MKIPFVKLEAQWELERRSLLPIIEGVLTSGSYVGGERVSRFEKLAAEYCGVAYCAALNSGTDALMCALWALGVRGGDEVITPPNSFIASTAAIVHLGATPVFVDVLDNQLIDPNAIEKAITDKTKAIMPVNLTGKIASMAKIQNIAEKYSISIVEDAAQSMGSMLNGRMSGSFGHFGCFSTHPLKNLNACGDGGFVVSNDEELILKIKAYRNHGFIERNIVNQFGLVSRMDELQSAILSFRIKKLDKVITKRRENAKLYINNLNSEYVKTPQEGAHEFDSYHTFVIQCHRRDELACVLRNAGIQTAIHYPTPIHLQPASESLGYKIGDFPRVEAQASTILTLPIHQFLEKEEISKIIKVINNFYGY